MKKCLAVLLGLVLALTIVCTAGAASVTAPALKCDGGSVDSRELVVYDLADGTLTIKWTPQSAADHYYYKCIGLNEKPDFDDSYQGNRGTILAEGTVTSNTTSKCKFTLTTSKMEDYDYLKIAVAAYDSDGKAYWKNFGVELTDSDKIVTVPALKCDGSSVDSRELVDYDLSDGTLTIKWTPQSAADHYYYKCIGLNEKPDFDDSYQASRGTTLAEGTVTSNTTTKCKFTLATSKMEDYGYLKIAVAAYDSDGKAYWKNFGVRLTDSSAEEMTLSDTNLSFVYSGDSDAVTVSGVSSFSVSHPTEDETDVGNKWLTVTKSGSVIEISARANYSASSRSETITVTSSDGQTGTIKVTQAAGYAAPTASIQIGSTAYSSGDTYGPLANGGEDVLWLYVNARNARRIHVDSGSSAMSSVDLTIAPSSTSASYECAFRIPEGLTPGTYTFTIYVSNSDVKDDKWSQAITPIKLYVTVIDPDADPYPPVGSTLLAVAQSQLGYKGSASSNNITGTNVSSVGNYTKYGAYTGTNGQASVLPGNPTLISDMANGMTGSGKIIEVTLAIDSSAVLPANVKITPTVNTLSPETEHTLATFMATITNGSGRIPGDVTSDGKVTTADFLRLGKHLAGWENIAVNFSNADVTGDGKVTTADFLRLGKKLAGWEVELK